MKNRFRFAHSLFQGLLCILALPATGCFAGNYTNFDVAIYIPVGAVRTFENPETLSNDWERISSQLKVDKVYIEVQRNRLLAGDDLLEQVKKFFLDRNVRVAGGMALSDGGNGQFRSFCYTDSKDREFVKNAARLAARHFDEVIQDDFFFVTTKYDSDIAARGKKSWTQFRLDLMRDAAKNLVVKPAKAVNPKVKMVIKFPNWYEHFQGSGYDLDREPKIFDGIYTGTETRDPEMTDQNLQAYESYQIFRYFENIAPGRNGGGWVDTFSVRYVDRYAEQLWNTMFAKAPEMMLFNWAAMLQSIRPGDRTNWQDLPTSFDYQQMLQSYRDRVPAGGPTNPTMARVAGYSLEQVDTFLGKLGNPIGIQSYKPYQSTGEDFLHNYFGMIGIPIDLHPVFPTNASLVLLTESAKFDPGIVAKIKRQLVAGKSVIITSGLLRALQGKGIEDIVEVQCTDRKVLAHKYTSGFGSGNGRSIGGETNADVLFPEIDFFTNDAWALVRAMANGRGYPLLLMDRYGKGVIYIWTIPDNFNDLYQLPAPVTAAIKNFVMRDFPVQLNGPGQVALFAYDNNTFIVESYLASETDVTVSLAGEFSNLRNLVTGGGIAAEESEDGRWQSGGNRVSFRVHLLPHSYSVFAAEK
jgi:hypothetical protein